MRNSRGGLGDIPSLGKAGALPASAQSRRVKARGQVCGPKGRPFRQRVNAVCRALPRYDLTCDLCLLKGNRPGKVGFAADSLVEDAVTSEPVSETQIPC